MPELAPVREAPPEDWLAIEGLDTFTVADTKVYAVLGQGTYCCSARVDQVCDVEGRR